MSKLKVTQIRSVISRPEKHRRVITALGLHHHQAVVIHNDTPAIRGMLHKVRHMVRVEEVE
jgi:large subunit ribosomal protein L30